mgnify:CR=1 FL=1
MAFSHLCGSDSSLAKYARGRAIGRGSEFVILAAWEGGTRFGSVFVFLLLLLLLLLRFLVFIFFMFFVCVIFLVPTPPPRNTRVDAQSDTETVLGMGRVGEEHYGFFLFFVGFQFFVCATLFRAFKFAIVPF